MTIETRRKGDFTFRAYQGDRKTLLAFDLPESATGKLAGFTIQCRPPGKAAYYIYNSLQFERPQDHAQLASEPANSSINAPIHKFRWLHVPGSNHQGLDPVEGVYLYSATPRYFDGKGSLLPLDKSLSAEISIPVARFRKGTLSLGFTRGFVQSQAYVNHFGKKAVISPAKKTLLFDTSAVAGSNGAGESFTYADEYGWLGYTARELIFELLDETVRSDELTIDMFAYDLNEPDIIRRMQALAKQGRIRLILDNASLHHDKAQDKPEDQVEALFDAVKDGGNLIKRGHFGRYAHDKAIVVRRNGKPVKVLTGSTNFSITGLYVNANHVMVFEDETLAGWYGTVFDAVWSEDVKQKPFADSDLAKTAFPRKGEHLDKDTPSVTITFSPHAEADAAAILNGIVRRIEAEDKARQGSVLFAVMELSDETNPVYGALDKLHKDLKVFSYGVSDNPDGIHLYPVGKTGGVLVTGKPGKTQLPQPFNQVPAIGGHEIHHKFVVCGFNRPDAVVYCGSSNLALGGEQANGDNLLAIRDTDVATAFAIEALALVDHFDFLDRYSQNKNGDGGPAEPVADKEQAAVSEGWFLSTTDGWKNKYYDPKDLHYLDRTLFA